MNLGIVEVLVLLALLTGVLAAVTTALIVVARRGLSRSFTDERLPRS